VASVTGRRVTVATAATTARGPSGSVRHDENKELDFHHTSGEALFMNAMLR